MSDCETFGGGESFEAIVEVLGQSDAIQLCNEFGGQRLYVPKTCNEGSDIAKRIGAGTASRLSEAFGGNQLQVPMGLAISARRRRQLIGDDLFKVSANTLARRRVSTDDLESRDWNRIVFVGQVIQPFGLAIATS